MKKCFLIMFLLMVIPSLAQNKMRIAVMDFEAKDISKSEVNKISELIRNDMINSGKFIIVERAQMEQILNEQGFQQSGCTDVSCAVQIGKLLSANRILVGSVMELNGKIVITGRIVDVERGIAEFSSKSVINDKNDMVSEISDFVERLAYQIGLSSGVYSQNIPVMKEESQKDQAKKESEESFNKNISNKIPLSKEQKIYLWSGAALGVLSLASFYTGYYFNIKLSDKQSEYDKLADEYNSSTHPPVISSIHSDMDSVKEDADKYMLYRNISYGTGAAMLLGSAFFLYKFFTYDAATAVSDAGSSYNDVFFYIDIPRYIARDNYSIGGAVIFRF